MSAGAASAAALWHPVATEYDLGPRSIFRGQLLGRELAVWRADDGFVNVWENRCLHRGVRLTIGSTNGAELICRYHGWRYGNRSAGCTYIPAHPANAPARQITNHTFPAEERYGLLWTTNEATGEVPEVAALAEGSLVLRSLPVDAPANVVVTALSTHRFAPTAIATNPEACDLNLVEMSADTDDFHVALTATLAEHVSTAVFFVQPVDGSRSVIRPVLGETPNDQLPVLRHHATKLAQLVRSIEAMWIDRGEQSTMPFTLETPVFLPRASAEAGRNATLAVRVERKWSIAKDITAFELRPTNGSPLPTFQPGAHIDVHLSNGLVRQYSITNAPSEADHYRIAVKRTAESTGGSVALHDSVAEGDELKISEPRNGFPLRRNIPHTVLIAGGIGITPLLAMAYALDATGLDFDLHYFAADAESVAFADRLESFGENVHRHLGLSPEQTQEQLATLLAEPHSTSQVYACGPPPMLDSLRALATESGWPDDSVHVEFFANTTTVDDSSSFTIHLARSGLSLEVPSGSTILDVLRANDVPLTSSCEQGACGTCVASVLEGDVLHQDVYLSPSERAAGQLMLTCVSRATSDRLVLDL